MIHAGSHRGDTFESLANQSWVWEMSGGRGDETADGEGT